MENRRVTGRLRTVTCAWLCVLSARVTLAQLAFEAPPSGEFKQQIGWDYILDPQPDSDPGEFVAHNPVPNELGDLDGLWSSGNGSDSWDGTAPGDDQGAPGGIGLVSDGDIGAYLIEDTGDPSNLGFADPSNRKIFVTLNFEDAGIDSIDRSLIDDGLTFRCRFRLTPPDRQVDMPFPEPNGYPNGFNGFGIFNLVHEPETTGVGCCNQAIGIGLDVDPLDPDAGFLRVGEGANQIDILVEDPTEWLDVWLTVENEDPATPELSLTIYLNGEREPTVELDDWIPSDHDGRSAVGGIPAGNELGMGFVATGDDGSVEVDLVALFDGVEPPPEEVVDQVSFLRGDPNDSGSSDLTDAINILDFLFSGLGAKIVCLEAADFNDDGKADITDALNILQFRFSGGAPPAPPGLDCGPDPEASAAHLGCERYTHCGGG